MLLTADTHTVQGKDIQVNITERSLHMTIQISASLKLMYCHNVEACTANTNFCSRIRNFNTFSENTDLYDFVLLKHGIQQ